MEEAETNTQVDSVPSNSVRSGAELSSKSKLRDSCHACARSKVRCPKQKPSCSRCEARGTTCQYFFSRRPGRRRETSKSPNPEKQIAIGSSHANNRNSPSFSSTRSTLPSPIASDSNSNFTQPQNSSITTVHNGPENSIESPCWEDFSCEFSDTDFVMPTIDTPFDLSPAYSGSVVQEMNDTAPFPLSSSRISMGTTPSGKSSISSYSQILPSITPTTTPVAHISSCRCLATALDLLKTLSLAGLADADSLVSAPIILAENKQSIESVNNLMACPLCSGDSFPLTIFSMIALKILERYAVAARTQHQGTRPQEAEGTVEIKLADIVISNNEDQTRLPSHSNIVCCDDKTQARAAAQLVLGELHHMQRLVNQLSSMIKRSAERDGRKLEILNGYNDSIDSGNSMLASFSASTLELVESDVRKSLRSLSTDIIKELRQH
uniref:Transcriptional regulator dmxR14 n=1 Tax=Cryptosporiopsis sp. (strain 8999) TaxID=2572248 RepID=DMR14_CRYX8|nr:RecName: Full=Transcriptional regulator dmxR14; AltName: Full=Dimeric xanthone biosynthesis cluster protein R14 [Cryptosporiopsis sp. 8999]QCL09105.1 DmxR14 [Cryptosporiopsis sp. 8999]